MTLSAPPRILSYDFNFNLPKSVSIVYEYTQDQRILNVFRMSMGETMEELEQEAATRVRAGGRDSNRTTGNLVWAEFIHFTARPEDGTPDPHLHGHCFVFNATFDPVEQKWKAGQFGDIIQNASYYRRAAFFHGPWRKKTAKREAVANTCQSARRVPWLRDNHSRHPTQ